MKILIHGNKYWLDEVDSVGRTSVYEAVKGKHQEILQYLVKAGKPTKHFIEKPITLIIHETICKTFFPIIFQAYKKHPNSGIFYST